MRPRHLLEVQPVLPAKLKRLDELANNLLYSWDRKVRGIFYSIDPDLWRACEHNPKVFLRRVPQPRLDQLAADRAFLRQYDEAVAAYDRCQASNSGMIEGEEIDPGRDTIAYFCMEYGLYESLKLYSGGLGILAGDHCKAAADAGLPFVAVGLMYRQGYFTQTINREGEQIALFQPVELDDLPVRRAVDSSGQEVLVSVPIADRPVMVRVWQADVGHVKLLLLDTDVLENRSQDRAITYQLYGGDRDTRIAQEIVLGIGGVRALRRLGLSPAAWHINEGHPAFMILERCREFVAQGLEFNVAFELVAAATVFTTHTPVPAGHDLFHRDLIALHFEKFVADLRIPIAQLLELGRGPSNEAEFNMTAFALRGSRRHNGVSRVHRGVAANMESYIWPQIPPEENPLDCVANGVHVPTFLAREWVNLLDAAKPAWRTRLMDAEFWRKTVDDIPNDRFWRLRQSLKSEMLRDIGQFVLRQYERNNVGRIRIDAMLRALNADNTGTLVLGFARRFATYKRASLLFRDDERLARLLNNPDCPVIVLYAGKAHPQDGPGQQMIKELNAYTQDTKFAGKIFFVEGHDIALERKLVTGVDVWLNTPEYPLEASGTSGQKAAVNGVINLSILDGWWAEGYDGVNGWAIAPHSLSLDGDYRDRIEAEDLLDILEREVIPSYYRRDPSGRPQDWIERSKRSMWSVLPRFNACRMVFDYLRRFYLPAIQQSRALLGGDAEGARALAAWKAKIKTHWPQVSLRWTAAPPTRIRTGETVSLVVAAKLNGLDSGDVSMECLVEPDRQTDGNKKASFSFTPGDMQGPEMLFRLDLQPPVNGLLRLSVRMFPVHPLLAHRFETGCMVWL